MNQSAAPSTPTLPPVHVCIATGQNAANLIPLEQLDAAEVWLLQTPDMRASAANLARALGQKNGRKVRRLEFDDSTPARINTSAEAVAEQLDGRQVVLHATGGTKLMVLALRDSLRLVETGSGQLDILYADTRRQQLDWLGHQPRSEPMADVLEVSQMLLVQGYLIDGDSRHAAAQQRAASRAELTRELGDKAGRYSKFFSALAGLASRAADSNLEADLQQTLNYAPGGDFAGLLRKAQKHGLLSWDEDIALRFASTDAARYLAGGWLEEFVLLKLTGLAKPGRFACNLHISSVDKNVPNEIDAMLMHRNRALFIECKTGRQLKAQDALYKLAQLRQQLGGSVGDALYLSAQPVNEEVRKRAQEYRIDVLAAEQVSELVAWLKRWMAR